MLALLAILLCAFLDPMCSINCGILSSCFAAYSWAWKMVTQSIASWSKLAAACAFSMPTRVQMTLQTRVQLAFAYRQDTAGVVGDA